MTTAERGFARLSIIRLLKLRIGVCRDGIVMVGEPMQQTISNEVASSQLTASQDPLLSSMDLHLCETFYPLGFAVEIITNDAAVLEAAKESFGHMGLARPSMPLQLRVGISRGGSRECPREPTRRAHNHLYSLVADADNQALLDLKTCTGFVWLTDAAVRNGLYLRYNFLEKAVYLLLGSSVVTDLHAGCVSKNGKGILLCGDSGSGKSTLAYACGRAGWTYTS